MATDLSARAPVAVSRRGRLTTVVTAALAVPLAGLVAVLATRPLATTRLAESPLVGKPAPEIAAATLDGGDFRLASLRGRWVVVNFFATWCVPCRQEHPHLVRFHERHTQRGDAAVVGVIYDDSPDAVRRFQRREGGSWPMLLDPDGRIALEFGVAGVPESFVIAPDGVIVARIVGGVRDDELEAVLVEAATRRP